jgi:hypothetical protein
LQLAALGRSPVEVVAKTYGVACGKLGRRARKTMGKVSIRKGGGGDRSRRCALAAIVAAR